MSLKSTAHRYGSIPLTLHWLSAGLILTLIPMGFAMQGTTGDLRLGLYRAHAAVGGLVGILTLMRLVWWGAFDQKPEALGDEPQLQRLLAKAVHAGLYGVVLVLVLSGISLLVTSGLGAALLTGDPSLAPADLMRFPPRFAHGAMARLLIALLALHVLGAFYHHWIRRDEKLRRMVPRLR